MGFYFEDHLSMHMQAGLQIERTLDAIVRRYRGVNPPHAPCYRPYSHQGIVRGKDYRYAADFRKEFPQARNGAYVYAWSRIWAEVAGDLKFDLSVECPTALYVNQQQVFRSTIFEERYPEKRQHLVLPLVAGWNHVVLRFKKTDAGFGGVFGTWLGKLPYYFLMPTADRSGQEGWLYCEPCETELPAIPGRGFDEESTGVKWLPRTQWTKAQAAQGQCRRIFGPAAGSVSVGWTRGAFLQVGEGEYTLAGRAHAPITVFIADREVLAVAKPGKFSTRVRVPFGHHPVMVRAVGAKDDWGFELTLSEATGPVAFVNPCPLQGPPRPWIFAGPLATLDAADLPRLRDLNKLVRGRDGDTYWRLDAPDLWVRPYNENALYGRWNYPLGVTLYGLLHSAKLIGSAETQAYIVEHMRFCSEIFDYAMWDRQQYGGATNVHHLLTSIDSLDDCGSFGSSLLEVMKQFEIPGGRAIADYVADYIANKQVRLPDGTFFRKDLMHVFHEQTLWADDLYMSVPFLCRYYELTGETSYIDDAARQFLGFRERLFIPQKKLMSHVHDLARGLATGIPWGRGNGWVLFSLSELLPALPADHELRPAVLAMFRELCTGVLAQQDETGMWHQVLDEHDSYPETSCTSMFAYAFARGVQHGWLADAAPYVRAVFKAWEALNRTSIDRLGNVHGVCRGSEFSFTSDYYKRDLLWNLNDTHGIGIVLLAGVEVHRLSLHLQAKAAGAGAKPPAVARRSRGK
ncbi:MAG TPA: glycoside hydrolase family 88 protein [Opitutaceae bacterium]|nr:glycoside hydrolase family 88 protein [Opitutaceae bacterium]